MLFTTKAINRNTGRIGHVYGGRYHWSIINTVGYYDYALKYVYRNPVKAGLVQCVEDFSYSTIKGIACPEYLRFSLSPISGQIDLIPEKNFLGFVNWLNQPFLKEQDDCIRKGLKKVEFAPSKCGWNRNIFS